MEKFGVTDFTYLITIELHHSPDGNGYPAVGFEKRKDKAGGKRRHEEYEWTAGSRLLKIHFSHIFN
ncbi:MAG: hypothetical protein BGO86_08650 [Chryseobacterium sp. 36-9]|nr:MAG: hypothetical protein BGO86_08650 [Chryseobacterium sp. 36-9]